MAEREETADCHTDCAPLDFRTLDSLNSTYGAESPTDFYDGALIYDQITAGLDVARELALGGGTVNIAWGLEFRHEGYRILAGQPESSDRGPLGRNSALTGSAQSYSGFQPSNALEQHRENLAGYADLEFVRPRASRSRRRRRRTLFRLRRNGQREGFRSL